MNKAIIARVTAHIHAPIDKVWRALIDPDMIEQYMFGAKVTSDWKEGSPISWKGEFNGKPYEDTGTVLRINEPNTLRYSHRSGGDPTKEHTVEIQLTESGDTTDLVLRQDNNPTTAARQESEKNWHAMIDGLKKVLET